MASVRDNSRYKASFDIIFGEDSETSLKLCELQRQLDEKDQEIARLTSEISRLLTEIKDKTLIRIEEAMNTEKS